MLLIRYDKRKGTKIMQFHLRTNITFQQLPGSSVVQYGMLMQVQVRYTSMTKIFNLLYVYVCTI